MHSTISPKQKAKELVNKFYKYSTYSIPDSAKYCALIVVYEILNNDGFTQFDIYLTQYWQQVKTEIEKL
jgi:hypothetical protein